MNPPIWLPVWVGWWAVGVGCLTIGFWLVDVGAARLRARRARRRGGMLEIRPGAPPLSVAAEPVRPFDWEVDASDCFEAGPSATFESDWQRRRG